MNRRKFVSMLGAMAAVGVTSPSLLASQGSMPAAQVKHWDITTDVLVVGSGAAGIGAAIDARDSGADVLVIEKYHRLNGSSGMSGGVCYMGGGTPLQKALGFSDTAEDMYNYIVAASRLHPHLDKVQIYCEQSVEHFDWMVANGVTYKEKYSDIKGLPGTDASLYYSGSEENHPFNEMAKPAPRGHIISEEGWLGGQATMKVLTQSALNKGVRVQGKTTAEQLIVEGDGSIAGVRVQTVNGQQTIRTRKGVILCAGGFIHNRDMVKLYAPELYECSVPWGNAGDLGDGILMGMSVGAAAVRMDAGMAVIPLYQPDHVLSGIVVNGAGNRFIAEDVYHAMLGHEITFNQHGEGWLISDPDTVYGYDDYRVEPFATAATLTALSEKIGLPEGALENTVAFYNRYASEGRDPVFHKHKKYLKPLNNGPYTAYSLAPDKAFFAALTFGGLHTSIDSEVLNPYGEAIPGLFAAGRTTSGLPQGAYIASGISVGDSLFFGRRAGRKAAHRKA